MPKDDFFKIAYIILTELQECSKAGTKLDTGLISPQRFGVADSYWLDVLEFLLDRGYARGVTIRNSKTGRITTAVTELQITPEGREYLQDNATMKKVYNTLKELRDWMPGIML